MDQKSSNPLKKYFRQPKLYISLPSKGNFYPEGSLELTENMEFPVYAMTAKDELMFKTPDALLNGQATVDVIQSCVPNIKNAWNLPSIDLDAVLIAIRMASSGEYMDIPLTVPGTDIEKTFQIDLRVVLDALNNAVFETEFEVNGFKIKIRPLNYAEYTKQAIRTFEEQRIFSIVNNDQIEDTEKLAQFNKSFKTLTEITIDTMVASIESVSIDDEVVTDKLHIAEFITNSDKNVYKALSSHIERQKQNFAVPAQEAVASQEEQEAGAPATYKVPVVFDQSNFFV